MLAATLVPEHCSSGHRGTRCRWSHFLSFCLGHILKMCNRSNLSSHPHVVTMTIRQQPSPFSPVLLKLLRLDAPGLIQLSSFS